MTFDRLTAALAAHGIAGAVAMTGNRAGTTATHVIGHNGAGTALTADSVF